MNRVGKRVAELCKKEESESKQTPGRRISRPSDTAHAEHLLCAGHVNAWACSVEIYSLFGEINGTKERNQIQWP